MDYESDTTCPSHNSSFGEYEKQYPLQDHDTPIPGPSELPLQDQETPSPSTNSPEHEEPDKQSHTPVSTTATVHKTISSMTPNDIKITPVTLLSRPSMATTTKDNVIISPKPVESNKNYTIPMKPANHTSPQATR